ncbi:c-type cytochrome [Methylovirgula sp. 4M-Z18]|uniref:c-type cytochrome n=1 Tax=Methylovirgula sp. 4M-Z18 TaxID=2293567 RepID=UPI000E2E7E76|nr:c-type cytochrome [Methylovirgula sp. 4M-Z18]RFB76492.1 hypothetical protein DYH55_20360 [Methylovirgula sp. 4M-Z18]
MKWKIHTAVLTLVGFMSAAQAQDVMAADDVAQGHKLAIMICSYCHVAAKDQEAKPILNPPAPPFSRIAQRKELSAAWLQNFLTTTHRDISSPKGMPNPELLDYQIKQMAAYLLSLKH